MKQGKSKHQNYVAKNMEKFNRPATHKDKKKESKINGLSVDEYWIDEWTNEEYELHANN
jgi:hypothetical protein